GYTEAEKLNRLLQDIAWEAVTAHRLSGIKGQPTVADVPPLTVIAGKPRERGVAYGKQLKSEIRRFLDQEIYKAFIGKLSSKDEMLRYAGACGEVVREACPIIFAELEGLAEGAGLKLDEIVLITLHEELHHKRVLPKVPHCTAVAVGPPDTADG